MKNIDVKKVIAAMTLIAFAVAIVKMAISEGGSFSVSGIRISFR